MKIAYTSSVKVLAGWRSVAIIAIATPVSESMATVNNVLSIDGEAPNNGQSRTGANRQRFNGIFWAKCEEGKKKRISACVVLNE